MADFRRVLTALAVVVLIMGFASTASAQTTPPVTCTATAAVPPLLRAEGMTELVGDIVLRCTGGTPLDPATDNIPVANFTVFLGNTNVTSRILGDLGGTVRRTEALLLIDEPSGDALTAPANAQFGCPAAIVGTCPPTPGGTVPNLYQGLWNAVSPNAITFIGVPINPPGTTAERVFRITNVRANASVIGAGTGGIPGQIQAFITISGPTSVPVNTPVQTVGFVQTGLATSVSGAGTLRQCQSILRDPRRAAVTFTETFATSFKIRTLSEDGAPSQGVPGAIYNTESGLIIGSVAGNSRTAGLADFGTRLRATFNNIPNGLAVWVSLVNIDEDGNPVASNATPFAQLTATSQAGSMSAFATVSATAGLVQVPITDGTGVAVWEVLNASPLATESLRFGVHFASTANPGANIPALGTGTVSLSFAPAPPAFLVDVGGLPAATTPPIPRFVNTGVSRNVVTIVACRTNLLFPFVTNQAGFDTGLAIANTSADPFGTTPQTGTCTWNFFGANAPAAITTAPVAGGTVEVTTASASAPNFQGYVIAVCDFEFAHGYAFVSDVGARNLAMGYLALVIPEPARSSIGLPLGDGKFGEVLAQ